MSKRIDLSGLPRRNIDAGTALFLEGESSRELYVLLSGALEVYRDGEVLATITAPMSIVGEMSALTGVPRGATVTAKQRSTVIVAEDPQGLFDEYPQLGFKLARLLAERLRGMNDKYREIKQTLYTEGVDVKAVDIAAIAEQADLSPQGDLNAASEISAELFDALDILFDGAESI